MSKYKETVEDLNKKYQHTWCLVTNRIAYIKELTARGEDEFTGKIMFESGKYESPIISRESIESLVFDATFINNLDSWNYEENPCVPATYFSRSARRQWKRGLTNENTIIRSPIRPLYIAFGKRFHKHAELDFPLIRRLQNPTYPLFNEALGYLPQFEAVAISPHLALVLSNISTTRCLVANHFGFIGEAQQGLIIVKHAPALQEVRDFVTRTRQYVSVELDA